MPTAGGGFSLVELLVVVAIVALLAALLLPVLARAREKSDQLVCLSNLQQFGVALQLYSGDNHAFYPPNPDDGNMVPGHDWCPGHAGAGESQEFDPDILQDPAICLISPYLGGNKDVWRCPSDLRTGKYQGSNTNFIGRIVPAART